MKYGKSLGLAAVAAAVLMAFLGASSALATVLCKTGLTSGCVGTAWEYGGAINASLEGTSSLETTGGMVVDTCTAGTVADTLSTGSSTTTVSGAISTLAFTGCTRTTDVLANGSLEIHWISGTDNGTVTGNGSEVTINPPALEPCIYGTGIGTHLGTLTGGNPATLHIEGILTLIKDEGPFGVCPPDVRWTGSYAITSPGALYVSTS